MKFKRIIISGLLIIAMTMPTLVFAQEGVYEVKLEKLIELNENKLERKKDYKEQIEDLEDSYKNVQANVSRTINAYETAKEIRDLRKQEKEEGLVFDVNAEEKLRRYTWMYSQSPKIFYMDKVGEYKNFIRTIEIMPEKAKIQLQTAKLDLKSKMIEDASEVDSKFNVIVDLEDSLKTNENRLKELKRDKEDLEVKFKAGTIPELEVKNIKREIEKQNIQIEMIKREIENAKYDLKFVCDLPLSKKIRLDREIKREYELKSLKEYTKILNESNLNLNMLKKSYEINKKDLDMMKEYVKDTEDEDLKQLEKDFLETEVNYNSLKDGLEQQLKNKYSSALSASDDVEMYKLKLGSKEEEYRINLEKFSQGLLSETQILKIKREFEDMKIELEAKVKKYENTIRQLEYLVGLYDIEEEK